MPHIVPIYTKQPLQEYCFDNFNLSWDIPPFSFKRNTLYIHISIDTTCLIITTSKCEIKTLHLNEKQFSHPSYRQINDQILQNVALEAGLSMANLGTSISSCFPPLGPNNSSVSRTKRAAICVGPRGSNKEFKRTLSVSGKTPGGVELRDYERSTIETLSLASLSLPCLPKKAACSQCSWTIPMELCKPWRCNKVRK